jgi:hypothetical protein
MVLKRKRSESELGSVFSSAQRVPSGCFNFDSVSAMDTARRGFFAPRLSTPSHLPSRTVKRFRDNRPSESEVHRKFNQDTQPQPSHLLTSAHLLSEHTLDVLYSAQRRPHHERQYTPPESPKLATAEASLHAQGETYHGSQQRSLHSFWNLPGPVASTSSLASSPASSSTSSPPTTLVPRGTHTNCEDCGAGLGGGDDDVMIDADGYGPGLGDQACGACGKAVCFSCSISNLGEHRRCLACAGPRGGAGGSWLRR